MAGGHCGLPARMREASLGLGMAVLLAGCGGQATAQSAVPTAIVAVASTVTAGPTVATRAVSIHNFAFNPQVITVPVGATVTWTNDDIEQHTATADDKSFNSDAINNGKTFAFTFTKAGTFRYSCLIHPDMIGQVIVTAK
ncbi:MAG: cupredoxin domain-containing protein [Chloroflexota bacterium]